MTPKTRKAVLIVDDDTKFSRQLANEFIALSLQVESPYVMAPDVVDTVKGCIDALRERPYDLVIIDVKLPGPGREGLLLNLSMAIREQFGNNKPLRVVITHDPRPPEAIAAMRQGAWDYIDKKRLDDKPIETFIFDSCVAGLQRLDMLEQQDAALEAWLPQHAAELKRLYPDKVIALWHEPTLEVIAVGVDAFDVHYQLTAWYRDHEFWQEPKFLWFSEEDA
jgi:ActR/RegA family two-component response regulator